MTVIIKQKTVDIDLGLVLSVVAIVAVCLLWQPILEWICMNNILKGQW